MSPGTVRALRIVSLVPGATDTLVALGLGEQLVAVSHECRLPAGIERPRLVASSVDPSGLSSAQIDTSVREHLRGGRPLFHLDGERLRALRPDLIVTQQLCEVCAVGASDIDEQLAGLPHRPAILSLHPHHLIDVLDEVLHIGAAASCDERARDLRARLTERLTDVQRRLEGASRPRVFCIEWLEPLMATGHWVPEQVEAAGGFEAIGLAGERSRYVGWEQALEARPDVLVVMPCGLSIEQTRREWPRLTAPAAWADLPAVRASRVFVVDGPRFFNCPGPRLVDGVELLARLFHPDRFPDPVPTSAALRVDEAPACGR